MLGVRKWVRCISCWQSPAFFFSVVTKIDFFTLSLRLLRLIRKAMPSSMKPFQMLVEISAILVSSLSSEYLFSNSKVITVRKRSCGKVMFLHLSVILSTGGCLPQCMLRHTHPGQTPPPPSWADSPPPPQQMATAVDGTHPTGMHSCLL